MLAAHALAVVFVWCHAVEPDVLLKIHIVLLQIHGVSLHMHGEKWGSAWSTWNTLDPAFRLCDGKTENKEGERREGVEGEGKEGSINIDCMKKTYNTTLT